eukprot:TRINITY_DN35463_c0_g1_i1.p1 TRINITY_DN35463_c0_g1~~TRINITY_DN35463_c0_g1_i1.p1  ORF type:complete len:1032 (+),score=331.81 TRINITY_DN35463_c0_g1_i1:64-3096(+)
MRLRGHGQLPWSGGEDTGKPPRPLGAALRLELPRLALLLPLSAVSAALCAACARSSTLPWEVPEDADAGLWGPARGGGAGRPVLHVVPQLVHCGGHVPGNNVVAAQLSALALGEGRRAVIAEESLKHYLLEHPQVSVQGADRDAEELVAALTAAGRLERVWAARADDPLYELLAQVAAANLSAPWAAWLPAGGTQAAAVAAGAFAAALVVPAEALPPGGPPHGDFLWEVPGTAGRAARAVPAHALAGDGCASDKLTADMLVQAAESGRSILAWAPPSAEAAWADAEAAVAAARRGGVDCKIATLADWAAAAATRSLPRLSGPLCNEDAARGAPLVLGAMRAAAGRLLRAAELLGAARALRGGPEEAGRDWALGEDSLLRMRADLSEDPAGVAASLLPVDPGGGAAGGVLPVSFLPPAPDPAMAYFSVADDGPGHRLALTALPATAELIVVNDGSVPAPRPVFSFRVSTAAPEALRGVLQGGICDVASLGGESGSEGSGGDEQGGEVSSGEGDDDAPPLQKLHNVTCQLFTDAPALSAWNLSVRLEGSGGAGEQGGFLTSSDEADEVANLCIAAKGLPGGVVQLSSKALGASVKLAVQPVLLVPAGPLPWTGLAAGAALAAAAALAASARRAPARPPPAAAAVCVACWAAGLAAGVLGLIISGGDQLSSAAAGVGTFLVSAAGVVLARGGLAAALSAAVGLAGGWAAPGALLGQAWASPDTVAIGEDLDPSYEVTLGRVADELRFEFGQEGAAATVTLWHGKVCRADLEYWMPPPYPGTEHIPRAARTLLSGWGSAAAWRRSTGEPRRAPARVGVPFQAEGLAFELGGRRLTLSLLQGVTVVLRRQRRDLAVDVELRGDLSGGASLLLQVALTAADAPPAPPAGAQPSPQLLVAAPVPEGAAAAAGGLQGLRPPPGLELVRLSPLPGQDWRGGLLVTLRNGAPRHAPVSPEGLCNATALPGCRGRVLRECGHDGGCCAVPAPTASLPPGALASFALAPASWRPAERRPCPG